MNKSECVGCDCMLVGLEVFVLLESDGWIMFSLMVDYFLLLKP
jgi:hypothetical protein